MGPPCQLTQNSELFLGHVMDFLEKKSNVKTKLNLWGRAKSYSSTPNTFLVS